MLSNRRISNFQSVERSIVVKSVFQISDSAQNSQLYECKYFANSKFPDLRISEFPTSDTLKPQNFRIHLPIAKFPTAFNPPKYKSKHSVSDERDSSDFQQRPSFCRRSREIIFARPRKSTVTLANRRVDNIREQRAQPLSSWIGVARCHGLSLSGQPHLSVHWPFMLD